MDEKYLSYILAIEKYRNITKAAESLYVSQSTLSQYLARLEQELGAQIFYRDKNGLRPTQAGEIYLNAAHQVLQIKERAYADISNIENNGKLSVGATSSVFFKALANTIPLFKEEYPNIDIEIIEGDCLRISHLLKNRQLDLGMIATTTVPLPDEYSSVLRKESICFVAPGNHPYCRNNTGNYITQTDIARCFQNDRFLLCRRGSAIREITDHLFAQNNFYPHILCELNNIPTILEFLRSGHGVSFIGASCAVQPDIIKYYSVVPEIYRYNIVRCQKNSPASNARDRLYQQIVDYFRSHS